MRKSQRLRANDVRSAFRLLSDLREMRHDRPAMHIHFIDQLMQLVGGTCGFCSDVVAWRPDADLRITSFTPDTRSNGAITTVIRRLAENNNYWEDPSFYEGVRLPGRVNVLPFTQLLAASKFERKYPYYNLVKREVDHVDHLLGWHRTGPRDDDIFGLSIHRWGRNERPFSKRDTSLARLIFDELDWLQSTGRLAPPLPGMADLPPRLAQVLALLRAGQAPKQIAAKLGLSIHTVRDHIKRLHARFGVNDRGELMAVSGGGRAVWPPVPATNDASGSDR